MERIGGLERLLLGVESRATTMDTVGIVLLDPSTSPDAHDTDRIRAELARRVPLVPELTRRPLSVPLGGPLHWITDHHFTVEDHLEQRRIEDPDDPHALARLVVELTGQPLDRRRPLWKIWYVQGLPHGRVALLVRMHHALLDASGGIELFLQLCDRDPLPLDPADPPPVYGERPPIGYEMLGHAVRAQARIPLQLASRVVRAAGPLAAASAREAPRQVRRLPRTLGAVLDSRGPRTVFDRRPSGPERSLALGSVALEDVHLVQEAFRLTVQDVVLAAVAGAVREYLLARDELPPVPLVALCPEYSIVDEDRGMTVRTVPLPTHLDSAQERVATIAAATAAGRVHEVRTAPIPRDTQPSAALAASRDLLDAVPPVAWSLVGRAVSRPLGGAVARVNVGIASVQGPPEPRYFAGARITHIHGRVTTGRGVGLFVHALTYADTVDVAVTALADLVPDPDVLVAGVRREVARLRELSRPAAG